MSETITKWHRMVKRPLTEEEKVEYSNNPELTPDYFFDCELPEDGQEILIATEDGFVSCDVCGIDYGYYLEKHDTWDNVVAWAEMPRYEER